ncbi:ATP-dependent Clp protease proteolytic subunit 6, chloroplastic [Rhodamnia argentea]|uniref:ATP-dependent Clp protease proteolytic subunit n=1 Tax=Rhodamnia argentea TaxID=178133 RepID=A0ABM3HF40_9MYRT|nr:ATP-dependent Clp protease proteolytic subunit 6, chloroplastic [Rhodamnia argentea]
MSSMYGGSAFLSAGSSCFSSKSQALLAPAPFSASRPASSLSCSAANAAPRAASSSRIVAVSGSMEMGMPAPYGAAASGLSSRSYGVPQQLDTTDLYDSNLSRGAIEAKKGNPPVMPAVMTPGGPLDLSSVLFRNRIIFVGQPVNSQVAQQVISQLVTLATIDEDADILMYLNCPGGSTYSVLAIYDCMSWIKPKVGTVCFGVAASQGALLLAGGEKGMRYSMPNARIMIHQPQSGCGGHVEDVRRQVNEAVQSRHKIDKMYAAFTGQPLEKVQQYTERDRFLSVSEAMEFGLIDGVLETEY